jgi:hypothetical protein
MTKRLQFLAAVALLCLAAAPSYAVCTNKPIAVTDVFNMNRNTTLSILNSTLKSNDLDFDGDVLSAGVAAPPKYGSFCGIGPDGFCYQPNTNFWGLDSISYYVTDGCSTTYGTVLIFVK